MFPDETAEVGLDSPAPTRDSLAWEALRAERPALELGRTLGEGAMGLVHLGTQTRLGRYVAVKTLREDVPESHARALLHEAWVTGALEHPNIVPIYDLGLDGGGRPQVVLKRIEGTPWTELLAEDGQLPADAHADPIAWHLRVLVQVCQAVEFAHSRGILHRDLKPDNVMIGRFGATYVLDWGIAVSLDPNADGRFPRARSGSPAGTPLYMAPEMARGDADALSPRSDVYLLAGLLYEILSGRPPHAGDTLDAVLDATTAPIAMDPSWPEDLLSLLQRGLALEPGDRPTVETFRTAVERHLQRRGLVGLFERCRADADGVIATSRAAEPDRAALYRRFYETRFGLSEVLRQWPDHRGALDVSRELLLAMAVYELGHGDARAARVFFAELPEVPADLLRVAQDLEREQAEARDRLDQLTRDASVHTGARTRLWVLLILAIGWALPPVVLPLFAGPSTFLRFHLVGVFHLLVTSVLLGSTWSTWNTTRINRAGRATLLVHPFIGLMTSLAAQQWGLTIQHAKIGAQFASDLLILMFALLVDRRFLPAALVLLPCLPFLVRNPEWADAGTWLMVAGLTTNAVLLRDSVRTEPAD